MRSPILAAAAALVAVFLCANPGLAHDWYGLKKDPVYGWSCCGGHDCARWTIKRGNLKAEARGFRVRLSLAETRAINPDALAPIDAVVDYGRVQPSEDGDWHLCVMTLTRSPESGGVYCLFQPPNI